MQKLAWKVNAKSLSKLFIFLHVTVCITVFYSELGTSEMAVFLFLEGDLFVINI